MAKVLAVVKFSPFKRNVAKVAVKIIKGVSQTEKTIYTVQSSLFLRVFIS